MPRRFAALGLLTLLGGCVNNPPIPISGDFIELTPRQTQGKDLTGKRVRWGGEILKIISGKDKTCFELAGYPVDEFARPLRGHGYQNLGHFITCRTGFYDSTVYARAGQ